MNSKIFSIAAMVIILVACAPAAIPTRMPAPTVTRFPTATPFPTPTSISTATASPAFTPVEYSPNDLFQSADVSYWTEIIALDPQNPDSYYQRASAMNRSNRAVGSLDAYIARLNLMLQDIDNAIALRPDTGDYYSLRLSIYDKLSGTTDYIVDNQYWSRLALEDAIKAYELGTTAVYPDRTIINELIATDQCDKALSSVQKLMAQLPSGDLSLGGLLHIRSRAYACLGRLNDALQSVNDSMFNNAYIGYKNELKAQYLILLGQYDEALPLVNEEICHCELSGWHHYLRAEIYYNTGRKDLVQDELYTGMMKTWGRGGMLPYVEAQKALDEGRTDDAIQLLKLAEATFSDPIYNSLRWKVQEQLKTLGAEPLAVTPSVPYLATPIP